MAIEDVKKIKSELIDSLSGETARAMLKDILVENGNKEVYPICCITGLTRKLYDEELASVCQAITTYYEE